MKRILAVSAAALLSAGCAVNLGGPSPEEYETVALTAPVDASPEEVADIVRGAGAAIALITSPQDSAWFARVSELTGLALSGPGLTESPAKGFLTNLEVLGDTSIVLGLGDSTRMHMHDALYQVGENRLLDVMLIGMGAESDVREAARTLLSYIATDVGANAAIIIGVQAPTVETADSLATLLRAAYATAWECVGTGNGERVRQSSLRLFYGPSARMRCSSARILEAEGSPIAAHLIVGR
ncbi:MAG: hypothetical protein ACREL7_07800 [Longimicrobiales bacterium]